MRLNLLVIVALTPAILIVTAPACAPQGSNLVLGEVTEQANWVPGEIIIGFHDVPAVADLDDVAAALGTGMTWRSLRHAQHSKGQPGVPHPLAKVRVATVLTDRDVPGLARLVARLPVVAYAEPNYRTEIALEPNDPLYHQQYGPQLVGAESAWDLTAGNGSVILAVADTGINFIHEDFQQGAIWVNDDPANGIDDDHNGFVDDTNGWDFIGNDPDPTDGHGHGSHVAGIAAARLNNGVGMAGMSNVTIMPLQVFGASGGGTWTAIAEAVAYATDNDAAVINYSGGGANGSQLLSDTCVYAYSNGVPVVAAAGNWNASIPYYPAAYPTVIAVSGTDRFDQRYMWSNYGNWLDVAAPGVDVFSCWRNGCAAYYTESGTSMSAPHVAGLVALMRSLRPGLTPDQIRQLLRENTVDLGDPGFDIRFGWGRIDAYATLQAVLALGSHTLPSGLDIIRGRHLAGDLRDLYASDDSRLKIQAGPALALPEPPVWIDLTAKAATAELRELRFVLETCANSVNIEQKLSLFNYGTKSYEVLDVRAATLTDSVVEVVVTDAPGRFVDPQTHEMRARLQWGADGVTAFFPWMIGVDQTVWIVAE